MVSWQEKANSALKGIKQRYQVPMAELTTFKIGGPLDLLVEPENMADIQKVLTFCQMEKLPWMIIGMGSNLLVRDKGIRGIGIKLGGIFTHDEFYEGLVTAGAGMALGDLAKKTACQGLSGLEFACGIPGTVGGGVYMNAGAYDGEMAGVLKKVQAFDVEKGTIWYDKAELDMGYRHSRFQGSGQVITAIQLDLKIADKENATAKIAELTCQRESKQPLEMPSAGSVFRRPVGYYVGPLIEKSGLKGFSIGGAQVSMKHAGFIVNNGGATAADVLKLIEHIREIVKQKFSVELIPEIRIVGEE
ncbi:MAG TPA: UDP-N-acetylmuramate dehydrogenase [Firmicutes bacterium]|jgi:UDP-N-acetylmuramate dehydrogenase|nr:UDP-N-acetylmuramate dehydrogenase [Bacillota bacterium]